MARLNDVTTSAIDKEDVARQIESMQKQLNEWARLISNEDRTKIIKDDSGTNRILLGYQQGGFNANVGLKVSQENQDVVTATNDQLVFNSDNNLFKIISSGTTSIPGVSTGNTNSSVVAHGQSSVPAVIAYAVETGSYFQLPYSLTLASGADAGKIQYAIDYAVDSTNVTFWLRCPLQGVGTVTVRYYILAETAS